MSRPTLGRHVRLVSTSVPTLRFAGPENLGADVWTGASARRWGARSDSPTGRAFFGALLVGLVVVGALLLASWGAL